MTKKPTYGFDDIMPKATARGLEIAPPVARALMTFASSDPARPQLCGLGLDGEGDRAWLCATDGTRLIRMPILGTVPSGIRSTVWAATEVEQAELRLKLNDAIGVGSEGAPMMVLPWIEGDLTFVPVSQVVPSERKLRDGRNGFSPALVASSMKALDALAKVGRDTTMGVEIASLTGHLDPMRIDLAGRGVIVAQIVIMPCRDAYGDLPASHAGVTSAPEPEATTETSGEVASPLAAAKRPRRQRAPKRRADDETAHYRAEAA